MIKIDDHTAVDLDNLAEQHYRNLIGLPLVGGVNYHATASLIGRINKQKLLDNAIPDLQRVAFWDYLLNNGKLKLLITARPDVLKTIIIEIENQFGINFLSNNNNYDDATLNDFGKIVKKVFNYKLYRKGEICKQNCDQFHLKYCPYCNEHVTPVITNLNGLTGLQETQALFQLDHFYPQSRYPYLAVSFFNLIPGCSPCNAQLKLEKNFDIDTHFNPFHKRLDDYFYFELGNILIQNENDVVIEYSNKSPYPNNAIVDFKIIQRYNDSHKRVVFKFIKAFKNRSPKINKSLSFQIIGLFRDGESETKVLLDNYGVPLTAPEINDVFLGKLKRDIAIQMKLI
jgi:hypothetical protein